METTQTITQIIMRTATCTTTEKEQGPLHVTELLHPLPQLKILPKAKLFQKLQNLS